MRSLFLMEFEVLLFTTCLQELEQGLSSVTPGGPSGTQRRIWLLFSSHKEKVNALSQGTQPPPPISHPVPGWGRCGTVPSAAGKCLGASSNPKLLFPFQKVGRQM